MVDLKPCPFCNRELEHDLKIVATFHPKIPYEEYCPLKGFLFASDRRDIISAWNIRLHDHVGPEKVSGSNG